MKHNTLLVIALLTSMMANAQFTFQNIALLGQFNDTTVVAEPVYGIRYQSCWGWVHPTTLHEYGVIGSTAGTYICLLYTSPSPRDRTRSRMPSSA